MANLYSITYTKTSKVNVSVEAYSEEEALELLHRGDSEDLITRHGDIEEELVIDSIEDLGFYKSPFDEEDREEYYYD